MSHAPRLSSWTWRRMAGASVMLLVLALGMRGPLTATMFRHMLLHIPLILVAGVAAAGAMRRYCAQSGRRLCALGARTGRRLNEFGLPGLLLVSLIGAYWMIPKALDEVLLSPWMEIAKFVSVFLAGALLVDSVRRANLVIKLFFVGNFAWMAAIVGVLYQDSTARLCNFYLLGDQEATGMGLVVLAVVLPVIWMAAEYKAIRHFLRAE